MGRREHVQNTDRGRSATIRAALAERGSMNGDQAAVLANSTHARFPAQPNLMLDEPHRERRSDGGESSTISILDMVPLPSRRDRDSDE